MKEFKPHVPADTELKDFSIRALLVGGVFGILFVQMRISDYVSDSQSVPQFRWQ